ncbi:hypothetical protein [Nocardia farcinica]|uniref:hypothetical protein n=1 Tax=Nocardia farcinica TaxID=37329 RepID=UPI002458E706|nr:hypothetical protein [Nocardia farcinica]
MSGDEQRNPDLSGLSDALNNFQSAMTRLGQTATAQGAFGWMVRGDLEKAREALRKLPPDKLLEVSAAASALSALADEVAAEGGPQS